eukprot:3600999-Amphidinium_carterae.3
MSERTLPSTPRADALREQQYPSDSPSKAVLDQYHKRRVRRHHSTASGWHALDPTADPSTAL